jgi:NADH:ubiquinone oxidoreductase subunit E
MLTVTICVGSSCYVRGSDALASALEKLIEREKLTDKVELIGSFCMGGCSGGVSISVGNTPYREVQAAEAESFFYREILPCVVGQGVPERD